MQSRSLSASLTAATMSGWDPFRFLRFFKRGWNRIKDLYFFSLLDELEDFVSSSELSTVHGHFLLTMKDWQRNGERATIDPHPFFSRFSIE